MICPAIKSAAEGKENGVLATTVAALNRVGSRSGRNGAGVPMPPASAHVRAALSSEPNTTASSCATASSGVYFLKLILSERYSGPVRRDARVRSLRHKVRDPGPTFIPGEQSVRYDICGDSSTLQTESALRGRRDHDSAERSKLSVRLALCGGCDSGR